MPSPNCGRVDVHSPHEWTTPRARHAGEAMRECPGQANPPAVCNASA